MTSRTTAVADLRRQAGLTQEELAEQAGLSLKTIKRAEAGHTLSLRSRRQLAAALEVDAGMLQPQDDAGGPGAPKPGQKVWVIDFGKGPLGRWLLGALGTYAVLTLASFAAVATGSNPAEAARQAAAERLEVPLASVRIRRSEFTAIPLALLTRAELLVEQGGVQQEADIRLIHVPLVERWSVREFRVQD